jgi:hypothetical protein
MNKTWYHKGDRAFIQLNLEILKDYTISLEKMTKKELKRLDSFIEKKALKLCEEDKDFLYNSYSDNHWLLSKEFPNILRTSLFIKCYSNLEIELIKICRSVDKSHFHKNNLSDFRYIFQVENYFKDVVKINLHDNIRVWEEIKSYHLIRNLLVHNEGKLNRKGRPKDVENSKKVKEYIKNKISITLDEFDYIQLKENFIFEVLETIETFFDEFFELLSSFNLAD